MRLPLGRSSKGSHNILITSNLICRRFLQTWHCPMDGRTDQWTDTPSYRDVLPHLKMKEKEGKCLDLVMYICCEQFLWFGSTKLNKSYELLNLSQIFFNLPSHHCDSIRLEKPLFFLQTIQQW